ncbi:MAG: hypothetical protein LBR79_00480 [Oscillospiraceae bacterium]|nr:hypothetical protein [Oscillospiraceae bacterium]
MQSKSTTAYKNTVAPKKQLKFLLFPPAIGGGGRYYIINYSRYALKKPQFQKSFFR